MRTEYKNKDGLTEKEFLEQYQPGAYEKPSVTVDMLLFTIENIKNPTLKILLVKRGNHPYMNCWALPGGFLNMDESLETAVKRELKEETNLDNVYFEQLYTFSEPRRDPRMRVITAAYMALIPEGSKIAKAGDDVVDAKWFTVKHTGSKLILVNTDIGVEMIYDISKIYEENGVIGAVRQETSLSEESKDELAFDHANIIDMAISRIAGKCEYVPIIFNLMPETFTIPELQSVYELFVKKRPHNTLFRKRMSSFIEETDVYDKTSNRPAKKYKYKRQ